MSEESKPKRKRNGEILKIEKRLTELVETDPTNEEIYKLLKQLAYIYVNQNKFMYGYCGVEDVCHDVAADVWMNVLSGRKIKAWIYYIGKMIKLSYVTKQRNLEHEIIQTDYDPKLKDTVKRMCTSSAMACIKDFDDMERNLMLDNIGGMIYNTMKHIKFKEGTKEWMLIYCNVCINLRRILNGMEMAYFRLPKYLEPYVGLAIEQFKRDFRNSGFNDSISDNVREDLEMQILSSEDYTNGRRADES